MKPEHYRRSPEGAQDAAGLDDVPSLDFTSSCEGAANQLVDLLLEGEINAATRQRWTLSSRSRGFATGRSSFGRREIVECVSEESTAGH
jgi:hypothetical protein